MPIICMHVMVFEVRVFALFHTMLEVIMKYELLPVCLCMAYSKLPSVFEWIYKCIKCINSLNFHHGSPQMLVYHKPKHAGNQTCLFHVLFMYAVSFSSNMPKCLIILHLHSKPTLAH